MEHTRSYAIAAGLIAAVLVGCPAPRGTMGLPPAPSSSLAKGVEPPEAGVESSGDAGAALISELPPWYEARRRR
ncbi:MAG: hypothetical protein K0S65_1410, partial [Labilithrix sp.]|nr:hypothetical protein [Labilithrix sp.]